MASSEPVPIGSVAAELGEGPCWDAQLGRLVWVDIFGKRVHEYDPASGRETSLTLGGEPGCAVVVDHETLLAAVCNELLAIRRDGSGTEPIASLPDAPRLRFNDGKCDPRGRLWVGNMDREEREPLGTLYRFDARSGALEPMHDGITVSNGLGWSPAGDTMYYIDSPRRQIWAFDFEMERGAISNRRTLAEFGEGDGFPDGMTVDTEGRLWVAFWGGGAVRCLDPDSGKTSHTVELPVSKVTSCTFGGAGLGTLFITTAQVEIDLDAEPLAGRLFRAEVGARGQGDFTLSL